MHFNLSMELLDFSHFIFGENHIRIWYFAEVTSANVFLSLYLNYLDLSGFLSHGEDQEKDYLI